MKKAVIISIIILLISISSAIFIIRYNLEDKTDNSNSKENNYVFDDNPNRVVRIIDGDTFEVFSGETIRLLCIDAPEIDTEEGKESKDFLENMIYGEVVMLEGNNTDKYDRRLSFVYLYYSNVSIISINKEIVDNGYAKIFEYGNESCDIL